MNIQGRNNIFSAINSRENTNESNGDQKIMGLVVTCSFYFVPLQS